MDELQAAHNVAAKKCEQLCQGSFRVVGGYAAFVVNGVVGQAKCNSRRVMGQSCYRQW